LLAVVGLFLAGCSSSSGEQQERGVPVAGSFVYWVGLKGEKPIRIAVHAVRRTDKGTVLDWSATPIPTADVPVGTSMTLRATDLESFFGDQTISLVDFAGRTVYRPLLSAKSFMAHGLTRPLYTQTALTSGETSIFQIAFPKLPASASRIAVAFNGGDIVPDVPVTPVGDVPANGPAVDLAAALPATKVLATSAPFTYPQGAYIFSKKGAGQQQITVESVVVGKGYTTVHWTEHALTAGAGFALEGMPVDDYRLHPTYQGLKSTVADGPGLQIAGSTSTLRALYATFRAAVDMPGMPASPGWQACLCSDFQLRSAAVAAKGGSLSLSTTFPELPAGTKTVTLTFPGTAIPALANLPVTAADEPAAETTATDVSGTWHWDTSAVATPLSVTDWPAPLPDDASYAEVPVAVTDTLLTRTTTDGLDTQWNGATSTLLLGSAPLFAAHTATLLPTAQATLRQVAAQLATVKAGSTISLTGYLAYNDPGSTAAVVALSKAQASAVQKALAPLVHQNVRWTVAGKGKGDLLGASDPKVFGDVNRRIAITFRK